MALFIAACLLATFAAIIIFMAKLMGWDDTIVALATPPGIGAIGVIRVSGKQAIAIVNSIFPSKNLAEQPSHTLHVGLLKYQQEVLDEVVISLFKNPKSYTGEDVIEISCHGSNYIQQKIIETLTQLGCRIAKPGEFTQRAFLNGKLDLAQAEAVADLIASNTAASRNTAIKNIRGGFSSNLSFLREELIKFSALIELELDFSQEDVEFADRTQFRQLLHAIEQQTLKLLTSFQLGNVIKNGVQVAIIGKPNAGKSTLLNALLNEDRAIVSDIAGTTRDTIEEVLYINGVLFRLIDTAGIREHTTDEIETIGVGKSYEKANQADVVLYLYDASTPQVLDDEIAWLKTLQKPYVLLANKTDIGNSTSLLPDALAISAKNSQHLETLKERLWHIAVKGDVYTDETVITNARHYDALQKLYDCLEEIKVGMDHQITSDLLALDIRQALHYLGEITGEVTNEDQLDFIFSKFCIGK